MKVLSAIACVVAVINFLLSIAGQHVEWSAASTAIWSGLFYYNCER